MYSMLHNIPRASAVRAVGCGAKCKRHAETAGTEVDEPSTLQGSFWRYTRISLAHFSSDLGPKFSTQNL